MLHRLSFASDRGTQFVAKQRPRNVRIIVSNFVGSIIDKRYVAEALRWQRYHFAARRRSQLSCNMPVPFATCSLVARMRPHLVARMWPHLVARSGHSCEARIPFAENKHGHKLWPQSGHTFWICLERNAYVVATLWPQLVATFGFSVSAASVRGETWARKRWWRCVQLGSSAMRGVWLSDDGVDRCLSRGGSHVCLVSWSVTVFIWISIGELDALNGDALWAHVALSCCVNFAPAHLQNFGLITLETICDTVVTSFRGHFLATRFVNHFWSRNQICADRSPHRAAPHRIAPHRIAPQRTASHRIVPHRTNQVFENPDGSAPYVWKRNRTMRKNVARIHHQFFMIGESVSEYVF